MMDIQYFRKDDVDFAVFETLVIPDQVPIEHFYIGIVVQEDGQALAKAALYLNPHVVYQHYKVGLLGAYAATENISACKLLLETLEDLARQLGLDMLLGPMNGSTWEDYRFMDAPGGASFLMEKTHPTYYSQQWQSCGFEAIARYYSSESFQLQVDHAVLPIEKRLQEEGVQMRPIDLASYEEELRRIHPFLSHAFSTNFLYSPIGEQAFVDKYLPIKSFLQADFVLIAEHRGEVVGVFLCVADVLDKTTKTLIIKTIARDPAPVYSGLGHVMAAQVYRQAYEQHFNRIIHAFLKEEGTSTPISRHFYGLPFKTYSLYGKVL
jgi:hypothetical protein